MNQNGDSLSMHSPIVPVPTPSLQIAIDALKTIATEASTAASRLQGQPLTPTPLAAAAAPQLGESASESAEIEALMKVIPDGAAAQLKTWRLQNALVATAYPALAARTMIAAAAVTNRITVQAFWWGFHFVVPEAVMGQWTAGGLTLAGVVGAIAPDTGPGAPFVAAAAAYIAAEIGLMKTVDRGKGVYVSMTWFAPGIFVPTSI